MPFKRAGWLQLFVNCLRAVGESFQCPLSGLVGCNMPVTDDWLIPEVFQCPLSGLVGCNIVFNRSTKVVVAFQCPLSGLVGCNRECSNETPSGR